MNTRKPVGRDMKAVETTLAELIEFLQDIMHDDVKVVSELDRMMTQGRMRRSVEAV